MMHNSGGLFGPPRFRVGFTGTREGLTEYQVREVKRLLMELKERYRKDIELHHGDCIGGDAQTHAIAMSLRYSVILHPPEDERFRAYCKAGQVLDPRPYLQRNKDIVKTSNLLIAAPATKHEIIRSGTWSTIRYAKSIGVNTYIVKPEL